jgi:sugar lactone lactonase YvrE
MDSKRQGALGARCGSGFFRHVAGALVAMGALSSCGGGDGGGGSNGNARSATTYPLSGTVTGLEEGTITISNGADAAPVKASVDAQGIAEDRPFVFNLPAGAPYTVVVNGNTVQTGFRCELEKSAKQEPKLDPTQVKGIMPAGPQDGLKVVCDRVRSLRVLAGQMGAPRGGDRLLSEITLSALHGITVDKKNNLYAIDGYAIRRISLAGGGVANIIAGSVSHSGPANGSGTTARFSKPVAIAMGAHDDTSYNLYVAEENGKIRRISDGPPQGVVVTTVAEILQPNITSLSTGPGGTLYVANHGSLLSIDPNKDHAISEIAPAYGALGVAMDAGENIYLTAAGGGVNHLGGRNVASLPPYSGVGPWPHIVAGKDGNLYLADDLGVRRITPQGVVDKIAEPLSKSSAYITMDSNGNLLTAQDQSIRRITRPGDAPDVKMMTRVPEATGGKANGDRTTASFSSPRGLAVDPQGNVYVADSGNHTIRLVAQDKVTTFAGSAGQEGPTDGDAATARFSAPTDIAIDMAGTVYVNESTRIRRITATGQVSTPINTDRWEYIGQDMRKRRFDDIAVDKTGTLYATTGDEIWRFTKPEVNHEKGARRIAKIGFRNERTTRKPDSLTVDDKGVLYVIRSFEQTIHRIEKKEDTDEFVVSAIAGAITAGGGSADGIGASALFNGPTDIAVDAAGTLYVTEDLNHSIRLLTRNVDGTYTVSTLAGNNSEGTLAPGPLPRSIGNPLRLAVTPKRIYLTTHQCEGENAVVFLDR